MLKELGIRNFAIIDTLDITFGPGLNVLTGETGAGKSILVDAIELVLGERASSDVVRTGAKESIIDVIFENENIKTQGFKGIATDIDKEIIIRRIINPSGKSRAYINESPVTLSTLSEIGKVLLDIHGQHEHQSLLSEERQLDLLDSFGNLKDETNKVEKLYLSMKSLRDELNNLESGERERAQKEDLLKFQKSEIEGARLKIGEDQELEQKRIILSNAERLSSLASEAYERLYSRDPSVLDNLSNVLNSLKEINLMNPVFTETIEGLEGSLLHIEDVARSLRGYRESIENDPKMLEEIEERLDQISRLKKKYGSTIKEILELCQKVEIELKGIEGRSERIEEVKREIEVRRQELTSEAKTLSEKRSKISREIVKRISTELSQLGMGGLTFLIRLFQDPGMDTTDGYRATSKGVDRVEFLISNPGEDRRPLAKIASGGELSRVMLSLKTILAGVDDTPTLIFDEVDAGIGGKTADSVGRKLKLISKDRQVLCITHLPQIASIADSHFLVEKKIKDGRTIAKVRILDRKERIEEIARMLGGKTITGTSMKYAEEMVKAGFERQ